MWQLTKEKFNEENITLNGNRFLLGNGYMGYRGTLEEFGPDQQVGIVINGLYNQVPGKWREPVNSPNFFYTFVTCGQDEFSALNDNLVEHEQKLDIRHALHSRRSVFMNGKTKVTITAERFLSQAEVHLACLKYTIETDSEIDLVLHTGIDQNIWDLNGPHLTEQEHTSDNKSIMLASVTSENKTLLYTGERSVFTADEKKTNEHENTITHEYSFTAEPGKKYTLYKYAALYHTEESTDAKSKCSEILDNAMKKGYENLLQEHEAICEDFWKSSDVIIKGDPEAQFALRYSLYQLLILATGFSNKLSIPARGLSGQVYKGAVFWDTEMFMVPFYTLTNPAVARNLIMYRYHSLPGARIKAAEYGFRGAFFAWESQNNGHEACTHFNFTDVFTGRPMRTYFRDKQIHISADIPYAISRYLEYTGDTSVLLEGALEVLVECSRFFYSYTYYKADKERFELLDVTGPDEYHERVNNNAYTNAMVKQTLKITLEAIKFCQENDAEAFVELDKRLEISAEILGWQDLYEKLYLPAPDTDTLLIEQFDRYFVREDPTVAELKSRILNPTEYLGGGNGLAENTQILKQADVLLMLHLFRNNYNLQTLKNNWEYYEPRTEHGSSLSSCAYSMTAAALGKKEKAYDYFIKTAKIDLSGESKQYVGAIYIGGTHPAANGGSWMCIAFGFAGINYIDSCLQINPALPKQWEEISLPLEICGGRYTLNISKQKVVITSAQSNIQKLSVCCFGQKLEILPATTHTFEPDMQAGVLSGIIFDLDGVLLSTDDYHYKAWKKLADREGIYFDKKINERLRGVSRKESLEIILEKSERKYTPQEKDEMCEYKNNIYRESLEELTPQDVFSGVPQMLAKLQKNGLKLAVGSSSKNAGFILKKTNLEKYFVGCISDGNCITHSKPHPEVFLKAAEFMQLEPKKCLVVEDADAGIQAAKAANMQIAGVGPAAINKDADICALNVTLLNIINTNNN